MRIALDASALLVRSAGVKSYVWNWSRALLDQGVDVRLYPCMPSGLTLDHERSPLSIPATALRLAALHAGHLHPKILDWTAPDAPLFHASNQVRQVPPRRKLTATLHDFTCWRIPELHTAANLAADRNYAERILHRADGLIAVSESTRRDAIELLDLPSDRVRTIYSGVDERFFDAAPDTTRAKPYVLYVGTIEPRKNIETLLNAWKLLDADLRQHFDLVLAGPMGWASPATQARVHAESHYLGYVGEAQLPALTAGASVFVYPSLYEGFGFPVVQAMAAGVPVVTSNVSSLPEVTGKGGILVEPRSTSQLAAAITALLTDEPRRQVLGREARKHADQFRWARCASESIAFFEALL